MKHKSIAILCALALMAACIGQTYATGEDEPVLPAEVEQMLENTQWPQTEEQPPVESPEQGEGPTLPAEAGEQPPQSGEVEPPEETGPIAHVGLAYGSGALAGANLSNDVGKGYRFGYTDAERRFWQVGYTSETALSVVKTQNVYYGYNYSTSSNPLITYSDTVTSDVLVGCWHVRLPGSFAGFEEAQTWAWDVGGFPAWIEGEYQVRFGAYGTQEIAQSMAEQVGGTVVGTSAYGVSVVKTKTNTVLFQFDGGEANSLTVKPGTDDTEKTITHYRGSRYYGSFQFRRVSGGNMTVTNYLPMNDYLSCVVSQEMSASWPLEALKAQAVTARTYYERNIGKHKKDGFDLCYTTDCQAYPGMSGTTARTAQAVAETAGLSVWYDGKPATTYYFSSDGGGTEAAKNVWTEDLPYLCGVIDPYEATISDKIAYWDYTQTFTAAELTQKLQKDGYNCAAIVDIRTELSDTGNVIRLILIDANGKEWPFVKEKGVRNYLGLKSMRYTVTKSGGSSGVYYTDGGETLSSMSGVYAITGNGKVGKISGNPYVITSSGTQFLPAPYESGDNTATGETIFTFHSSGWGHHVGMSQWGAYAMAQLGMTFDEIITFYFPGVEIY